METNVLVLETRYYDHLKKMEKMNDEMGKLLTENQESEKLMEKHKQLCFKYEQHQAELDKVQKQLSNCDKSTTRNLKKKIKYRDNKIKSQSTEISELKVTYCMYLTV